MGKRRAADATEHAQSEHRHAYQLYLPFGRCCSFFHFLPYANYQARPGFVAMADEECRDTDDPPFTPEQLVWIDKLISARQFSAGSGTASGSQDGDPPPPTSEALPLHTTASQGGKRDVARK